MITTNNRMLIVITGQRNRPSKGAQGKELGPLDYCILDEEFDTAISKLKGNKAPGINQSTKNREAYCKEIFA